MAATSYEFSITSDFPNRKLDSDRLKSEILALDVVPALDRIDTLAGICTVWFRDTLSTEEHNALTGVIANHSGNPLPQALAQPVKIVDGTGTGMKIAGGKQVVSLWPTESDRVTIISPNWCDKTTWYRLAVRVVDEVADCDNPLLHTQYSVNHTYLIDSYHGKISQEDSLRDGDGNSFRVQVKVNDVLKAERDPHLGSGGDYSINYVTGVITFFSGLSGNDVVKVTYHYANGSEFALAPASGKSLKITKAEVQFGVDIGLTDSVQFQIYGLVDVFAPQLMPGIPSGTKIPLGDPIVYKTMADYYNDGNGAYPTLPALGGGGWRGMQQQVVVMPWDYASVTELKSSLGMEIRIKLEHDTPFTGSFATATFYGLSESE